MERGSRATNRRVGKNRLLLTKNKDGQTAGHLAAACGNIQALVMLWECAKGQITAEQLNSKIRLDRYLGKDCWHVAAYRGKLRY